MKLFTRYNRVNLLATIVIFLLASIAFYVALRYILLMQVDDDLKIEQHEIETYVKEHHALPEPVPVKDQTISYSPANEFSASRKISTVELYDPVEKAKSANRVLLFYIQVGNALYQVTVVKSLEGTNDLIRSILLISFVTILSILIASIVINRILLKRLWKPFYNTLDIVKNFKVDRDQVIQFPANNVDEFTFMDETLGRATNRARQDYLILKEFTENASHEMQTSLAIIRSKLDLFI